MKAFPLFLTVHARPLVVFGGGEEAAAKLRLLLKTEANVIAVASAFEPAVSELEGLTLIRQNPLCFSLPRNAPFAYAATGDEQLDADLARKARHEGVLVCAADQPAVSDFSTICCDLSRSLSVNRGFSTRIYRSRALIEPLLLNR